MGLFEPMWIAISTYSVFPAPPVDWNERNLRFSLCFLPLVGALVGLALWGWGWAAHALAVDGVLFAALATALPLLLTGGIHMDGFLDTVDALASHQSKEKKLEILKDSHVGAFAVIYCGVYLLVAFGLYHALFQGNSLPVACLGFILSRALSALGAVTLPNARKEGMLCAFTQHAHRRAALLSMGAVTLLSMGAMAWASPMAGGLGAGFGLAAFAAYRAMVKKQFGGATGDTTGFFLQVCELAVLGGAWIGGLL